ncbi:carbohydrate ABC transporter permease [Microbacterium sp. PMB16]|uniref:carbohydrate ABC transporter permease n=1 Tax=Microbacterium sp. PMB16 TaxID=3120157 RepID=UPI003F4C7568
MTQLTTPPRPDAEGAVNDPPFRRSTRRPLKPGLARASLALPALIVIVPLLVIIVMQGASLVTHAENLLRPGSENIFVGWDNFTRALSDPTLLGSIRVTLVYVIAGVGIELVLGVSIALALRGRIPGKGVLRALILIPMVLTPVVAGLMWRLLMDPTSGFINWFLDTVGIGGHAFLADPATALGAVILVEVWQNTPFVVIIVLAGLESLDPSPFEAAQLDGAGGFRMLWNVTLPMLAPVLSIVVLLRVIDAVKTFAIVNTMTKGGPGTSTLAISNYVYRLGFETFDIGYATTVGALVSLVVLVILFPTATRLMGLRIWKARR